MVKVGKTDIGVPTNDDEKSALLALLGRMAVLYGGTSAEREVSLQSGSAVMAALLHEGVKAIGIDAGKDIVKVLSEGEYDSVFIALHGPGGEDGTIQAILEGLEVPYTGSGILASALCMNKLKAKQIWQGLGISTPEYEIVKDDADWDEVITKLGGDAIVKPVNEGSSIGMSRVSNAEELKTAYEEAKQYDREVLVERFIQGAEYTVSIVNGVTLPPIKLETQNTFYDYEAKYVDNDTKYICPCGLAEEKLEEVSQLAATAFEAVSAKGWGRVDIMMDENAKPYVLEVNTVPGMTSHSLVPMAAKAAGFSFNELVLAIAGHAGLNK